jgi:hypothetical protein
MTLRRTRAGSEFRSCAGRWRTNAQASQHLPFVLHPCRRRVTLDKRQQAAAPQANGAAPPPNPPTGGGSGGRYCFSGDTKIIGEHGLIAFRDVRVGDVILTGAGTLRPVAEVHRHDYDGNLVPIDGGPVTESHELLSLSDWRH